MESINPAALGFALLCSSFPNPISSMSSQRTFIRARFLDYLPPSPSLPAAAPYCCALKCIKLNEVSVQVSSPPPPATPQTHNHKCQFVKILNMTVFVLHSETIWGSSLSGHVWVTACVRTYPTQMFCVWNCTPRLTFGKCLQVHVCPVMLHVHPCRCQSACMHEGAHAAMLCIAACAPSCLLVSYVRRVEQWLSYCGSNSDPWVGRKRWRKRKWWCGPFDGCNKEK